MGAPGHWPSVSAPVKRVFVQRSCQFFSSWLRNQLQAYNSSYTAIEMHVLHASCSSTQEAEAGRY